MSRKSRNFSLRWRRRDRMSAGYRHKGMNSTRKVRISICYKLYSCRDFMAFISVRLLREELQLLQEQGSYVGEVVKPMDKKKVLVKVHPEGKFVVDIDKNIEMTQVTPNCRVALRNDSYQLHKILPNKVNKIFLVFQKCRR